VKIFVAIDFGVKKSKLTFVFSLVCEGLLTRWLACFIDLANTAMPDERAVMTYVSSYYHCFSQSQKVFLFSINLIVNRHNS